MSTALANGTGRALELPLPRALWHSAAPTAEPRRAREVVITCMRHGGNGCDTNHDLCLSLCLPVCLSVWLSVCLSVYYYYYYYYYYYGRIWK
jgi:hypothetical protein